MENSIVSKIKEILKSNPHKGGQLYYLSNRTDHSAGDESGIETYIWTNTSWANESDELAELDSKICNQISRIELPEQIKGGIDWEKTKSTGLHNKWESECNDWISIQITDHSIYLIIFYSGQY